MRRAPRLFLSVLLAGGCSLHLDGDRFQPDDAGRAAEGDPPDDARPPASIDAAPAGDDPDAGDEESGTTCVETCPDDDCQISCPSGECDCALDCAAIDGTCKPTCYNDDCSIDCREVKKCEVKCRGATTCDIDCVDAGDCEHVNCEEGAACLLDCSGAEKCRFDHCHGTITICPDNVLACNRACP